MYRYSKINSNSKGCIKVKDKEKINNICHYLLFKEVELKNNVIDRENLLQMKCDTYNVLEYYKAVSIYNSFQEISKDIEKILF